LAGNAVSDDLPKKASTNVLQKKNVAFATLCAWKTLQLTLQLNSLVRVSRRVEQWHLL